MVVSEDITTDNNLFDFFKYITPNTIKEFILIISVICLIYYIYENQNEIIELKKENILINEHLKNIINGDSENINDIKQYYENVDNNIKSKKEIEDFKNKKKSINKDAF